MAGVLPDIVDLGPTERGPGDTVRGGEDGPGLGQEGRIPPVGLQDGRGPGVLPCDPLKGAGRLDVLKPEKGVLPRRSGVGGRAEVQGQDGGDEAQGPGEGPETGLHDAV